MPEDDDDREHERGVRPRQQRERDRAADEPGEHRRQPAAAIREATGERADDRLEAGGDQPRGADRGRAGTELVQPQRAEHAERAEQQAREPSPAGGRCARCCRIASPTTRAASRRRAAWPPGVRSVQIIRITPTPPTVQNTISWPTRSAATPITGPKQRAGDRRAHRGADHLPALLLRRGGGHPAHRARPSGGAAQALDEAGEVEHEDRLRERERDARAGHQPEADQHRRPHADPRGQPAAREPAHERADRERRGEHAGAGLRQAVLARRGRAAAA